MNDRTILARELANIFKTLGHADRVRIVEVLRARPLDVQAIAKTLDLSANRVSQHLAKMRAMHLVAEQRKGRKALYSLTQPDLAHWMTDGLQFLEARTAADEVTHKMISSVRRTMARSS